MTKTVHVVELTTPELLKVAKEQDDFSTMQEVGRGFMLQGSIAWKSIIVYS